MAMKVTMYLFVLKKGFKYAIRIKYPNGDGIVFILNLPDKDTFDTVINYKLTIGFQI